MWFASVLLVLPMVRGINGYAYGKWLANVLLGERHLPAAYKHNADDSYATAAQRLKPS